MATDTTTQHVLNLTEMARILMYKEQTTVGEFEEMEFSLSRQYDYTNAAHLFLFARNDETLWDVNKKHAAIMMQMRFDGQLGFAGGLLDSPEEAPHAGLNRELHEELGLDIGVHTLQQGDHLVSHVNHTCKLVTHFYAKEVSMEEFLEIEKGTQKAQDWGGECLGTIRVPLYRLPHKKTGAPTVRGLPTFLSNQFAGNARFQLAQALSVLNVLPHKELSDSIRMYADLQGISLPEK